MPMHKVARELDFQCNNKRVFLEFSGTAQMIAKWNTELIISAWTVGMFV